MSDELEGLGNELATLHDAITATIKAALPELVRVEAFPDLENGFDAPAVFFGLTEFKPGPDKGTGKTAIQGTFQALILVDSILPHAALQCMWIATRLATVLRGQYWGLDFVDCAENAHAEPTELPELESCVVWSVRWSQDFHVGDDTQWPWPDQSQEVVWDVDVVAG